MEKLKIKIHPTFIVFACVLIYFGQAFLFLNYLLVIFIHELCHAIVARKLGYNLKSIKIIPFGICLNINSFNLIPKDEIKIALAGPCINFFLTLLCFALWWIFPSSYNYTYLFCYANFITAIFNMIPAFPLDGGRILLAILKQKNTNKYSIIFCKSINLIISLILISLFIYTCFDHVNFTFLFVVFCISSGIFEKNKYEKYSFINFSNQNKISKIIKSKTLVVSSDVPLYKICSHIDNFSYLNLKIVDENKTIIKTFSEKDFINLIEKYDSVSTFKSIFDKNVNKTTF